MVVVDALEIGAVCYSCSTAAIMNGVHMFICSPVINSRATVGCCPIVVDLLSESMSTNENSPSFGTCVQNRGGMSSCSMSCNDVRRVLVSYQY